MSEISNKDVEKVARLAKIEVDQSQIVDLTDKMTKIVDFAEKLNEVDIDTVEPLINVNNQQLRMAKDEVTDGDIADKVLSNTKDAKYQYFAVPKVIE